MVAKKFVALVVFGSLGVILLVLGCVLIHVFTKMIHNGVEDNIALKNGSQSYKRWADPSSPIYFQVWMFDVVNSAEVLQGDKPVLIQKGPYTYREVRHKFDISYNKSGTLSYREEISYFFQPDMSVGSENDTFVSVNLPMLTVVELLRWEPKWLKEVIEIVFVGFGEKVFQKYTVHDLMWGYPDKILAEVNKWAKDHKHNFSVPDMIGLFYNKNNSNDGLYQIYSGLDGVQDYGEIVTWNGKSKLDYWNSEITNMINGSDGTIYPPFVDSSETKYLFSSDLCRSLGLVYKNTVNIKGIDLDQFVAPDIMFANVTVNPYNAGFCSPPGNCLPSGLLNVSVCRKYAPVIMSMPHFLGCDEDTVNGVIGLNPSREEHESYIDIEPRTGVAMNVGKKLQVNALVESITGFSTTDNIKTVVLPIIWLNESAMISDGDASDFKSQVTDKIKLTQGVQYGLIGLGVVLIIIVIIIIIRIKFYPSEPSHHINDDEPRLLPAA
uniref:Lysosome membrane protein 2 n=1 Tax=Arion vulgaris TaxID=1028688 RepID=A0A0B7ADR5_9EUPU